MHQLLRWLMLGSFFIPYTLHPHHPNETEVAVIATPCPSPLQRDVGRFNPARRRDLGRRSNKGDPRSGRPTRCVLAFFIFHALELPQRPRRAQKGFMKTQMPDDDTNSLTLGRCEMPHHNNDASLPPASETPRRHESTHRSLRTPMTTTLADHHPAIPPDSNYTAGSSPAWETPRRHEPPHRWVGTQMDKTGSPSPCKTPLDDAKCPTTG